ncbi:MAG: hypothetical protein H6508_09075 [Calditrichaeota bacterium]|nr:hypothetical protein [Calditrichota bacterium]
MPRGIAKKTVEKPESAAQLIKTVKQRTRKMYSAKDKIRVVLAGLRGEQTVAALCRPENLHPPHHLSAQPSADEGKACPERSEGSNVSTVRRMNVRISWSIRCRRSCKRH